jgi:hypothetical protein
LLAIDRDLNTFEALSEVTFAVFGIRHVVNSAIKKLLNIAADIEKNPIFGGILADGMYDSNNNFRYLSKDHIKPGIKTKGNSEENHSERS